MSFIRRAIPAALTLALGLSLSGCSSGGDFDPTDLLPNFGSKKPLPGERRAVFPEGVPGVPQGVPPDLVKGYQPPVEEPAPAPETQAEKPARPKAPAKPKPKKPSVAAQPVAARPAPSAQPAAAPWPDPPSR